MNPIANPRRLICALFVTLLAVWPIAGAAQSGQPGSAPSSKPPCSADCLTILSTGGFLGFVDGVEEFPGWPDDPGPTPAASKSASRGGLLGVEAWLAAHRYPNSILLLTGNNHPQRIPASSGAASRSVSPVRPSAHWFWSRVHNVAPDAVGVGTEDIHRWLSEMTPAALRLWLKDGIGSGLPFVATNAIVRKSADKLNTVKEKASGISIDVPEGESIDLINSLTVNHPCTLGESLTGVFKFDEPDAPAISPVTTRPRSSSQLRAAREEIGCHTKLQFAGRLRPGRTYKLKVPNTSEGFRFVLQTHEVLTPHPGPGTWAGLPVVRVTRHDIPLAIMAFASPDVAGELPARQAEWTQAEGCPAEKCRIDYLAPEDAARWFLEIGGAGTVRPPVLLLALADLYEEELTALVNEVPEIRLLAIEPESLRLGRAAQAIAAKDSPTGAQLSGDLSFSGVVDHNRPELTRFIVRPEWVGENVQIARAAIANPPANRMAWLLNTPSVAWETVPGATLQTVLSPPTVRYQAKLDTQVVDADPTLFPLYCPLDPEGAFDRSGERQGKLWTDPKAFTGLLLDSMRRTVGAEIAVVPHEWVDSDIVSWLEQEAAARPVNWLSGFILQRVLFRAERIVKVIVEGPSLAEKLQAIIKEAKEDQSPVCVSGLGLADECPVGKLDAKNLLVNVRRPESGHFYSIALPIELARRHGFKFDDDDGRDVLGPLDERLRGGCGTPVPESVGADPIALRLEDRLSAKLQKYVKIDPFTLEYASTDVHEPPGREKLFAKLPVDGSAQKSSLQVVIDASAEYAALDSRRFAVRFPFRMKLDQKEIADETSYDKDEFSIGLRLDDKRALQRHARVFAGVFLEGQLKTHREVVTATRKLPDFDDPQVPGSMLSEIVVDGPKLPFERLPQRFLYGAFGIEVPAFERKLTTFSEVQFRTDFGRAYRVPEQVRVGATNTFSLEKFIESGASGVLREAYEADIAGLAPDTFFGFEYRRTPTRQFRVQLDGKTATKFNARLKISTETRFRYYNQIGTEPPLATRWSGFIKASADFSVTSRWTVAPYGELTVVRVHGIDEPFRVSRLGLQVKVQAFFKRGHGTVAQ